MPQGRVFHLVTAANPTARLTSPILANDQFERHGYFVFDAKAAASNAPSFNRTVTLRDSWVAGKG